MTDFIYTIKDQAIGVRLCRTKRAKRMSLRFDSIRNFLSLTVPPRTSQKQILGFLEKTEGWILKQTPKAISPVPLTKNTVIPLLDIPYEIKYQPATGRRMDVRMESGFLVVQGPEEYLNRLTIAFLKHHAKNEFSTYCKSYAAKLGRDVNKITIRDTKSRWGSCSAEGNISLCWRLILAPKSVAEYVCAHEVAHLKEMNHSPDFWKLVERLKPDYKSSKNWLKKNGQELFKYT